MPKTPYTDLIDRELRKARGEYVEVTVGEAVTAAIDNRARAWHLEGRFFDKSLPELRGRIRKSVKGLKDLERSTEPYSTFQKSHDEASRFLAEWS